MKRRACLQVDVMPLVRQTLVGTDQQNGQRWANVVTPWTDTCWIVTGSRGELEKRGEHGEWVDEGESRDEFRVKGIGEVSEVGQQIIDSKLKWWTNLESAWCVWQRLSGRRVRAFSTFAAGGSLSHSCVTLETVWERQFDLGSKGRQCPAQHPWHNPIRH